MTRFPVRSAMVVAALCASAVVAHAGRPQRIVVRDFDGPRALADAARAGVIAIVGERDEVIPQKRWQVAVASARQRGLKAWLEASKATNVDIVLDGFVATTGDHRSLTVSVRLATTGAEIDSVTVELGAYGLSDQAGHQLEHDLYDSLDWVD